jgi:hypothetical protein
LQKQDEEDRTVVKSILDHYGVPTFQMVCTEAATDFVVLIQHRPPGFRREALPKLKANVESGQAFPKDCGMMYDCTQTDQGKLERCGLIWSASLTEHYPQATSSIQNTLKIVKRQSDSSRSPRMSDSIAHMPNFCKAMLKQ